ncbi:phytoene desaturase family protein [Taklimakanibacter deserti]|uniref:phytoene desaturase family protein n=1 Tax=Taklimakanibacter deserti TaxID=2267839 RepID=UPI000E648960
MTYDAIIVGSGHNGLASAIHLAKQGWKVSVFERNKVAGGAVQTREVTLPGFRHDLFAMNLGLFAGSPFMRMHGEALMRHGLAFAAASDCFATPFADGSWFGVSKDMEKNISRARSFSEEDAESWRRMSEAFGQDAPHIFSLLGSPMPSRDLISIGWKAWRARGLPWIIDTLRLLVSSPRAFLDANFESDKIKATLAAWGMHLDFAPDIAGGALFPYLEAMADQSFGMALGRDGADVMIKSMTAYLKELGGEIHLDAEVARIDKANGRAAGVTLTDGRSFAAKRAVIANVVPQIVFGKLLAGGSGNAEADRQMTSFRAGPGTMMIHVAADGLPDWAAGAELQRFAYVHLAPSLDMMSRAYHEALAGLLPAEPVLVVGQPTAVDPSRAPEGKHILWIQVRVLPATADWSQIKETYADRVMTILESYAPGFSKKILGRAVFSPLDLEKENPNLLGGDNLGGSHHLSQNFLFRPAPGWSRYKTPLDGLYLVGASTWPGAGVGAGSGFMLAKMLTR